ncbi:hypothetical protein BT96DRAFT_991481 [Gymnopus androsaceus JB14]|uniref:Uncharacterized protein n=1 Tax=Gymnopus androsaceus JB14 TaxID=1447944 RepID=A0A6A4HYX4_9AGAR|nr:hypothetical protein BT96DRAFT_991481 [Gymnopus androsaceus JB14]
MHEDATNDQSDDSEWNYKPLISSSPQAHSPGSEISLAGFDEEEFRLRRASSIESIPETIQASHQPCHDGGVEFIAYEHPHGDSDVLAEQPKRLRGRPPKAKPQTATTLQDDVLPAGSSTQKRRGRPRKTPAAIPKSRSLSPPYTFSTAFLVLQKDTVTRGRGGKAAKVTKNPPKMYGPVNLPSATTWDSFLSNAAQQVRVQDTRQLRIDTFQWYFTKRDIKFPLQDNNHYTHLLTRLEARKRQEKLIYVEMEPPLEVSNTISAMTMGSSLVLVAPRTDEYEGDSDDIGPMSKKASATAKLDDNLESIVSEIKARYAPGKACNDPKHASLCCFVHVVTSQHFDVGYRARALQWAGKIRREQEMPVPSVDITRIPIGEGWFAASHSLKTSKKPAVTSEPSSMAETSIVVGPSAPVNNALALQLASLNAAQTQMQMMLSMGRMQSGIGQGFLNIPFEAPFAPSASSSHAHNIRSSSPPIPETIISLNEFCTKYRLTAVEARLIKIEFEPGDNLTDYPQEDWLKAGFTKLSWDRVVKSNKAYRASLKV